MPSPKKESRNIGILTLHLLGWNQFEIARLYAISRQRVKQILDQQLRDVKR